MYIAKIPGTKYITSLESQGGQWFLRLKLDDVVEAEEDIDQLSKRAIHSNLEKLFKQVGLQVNNFQVDLIHKELVAQISHLLLQEQHQTTKPQPVDGETSNKQDPRVDTLLNRIAELEKMVKTLSDRVERMETLSE